MVPLITLSRAESLGQWSHKKERDLRYVFTFWFALGVKLRLYLSLYLYLYVFVFVFLFAFFICICICIHVLICTGSNWLGPPQSPAGICGHNWLYQAYPTARTNQPAYYHLNCIWSPNTEILRELMHFPGSKATWQQNSGELFDNSVRKLFDTFLRCCE